MSKIIIEKIDDSGCGTGLRGYITATYSSLVRTFGEPSLRYDGVVGVDYDKSDVEWIVKINGVLVTIYNWKNGQASNGPSAPAVEQIMDWNVGGKSGADPRSLVEKALNSGVTLRK